MVSEVCLACFVCQDCCDETPVTKKVVEHLLAALRYMKACTRHTIQREVVRNMRCNVSAAQHTRL